MKKAQPFDPTRLTKEYSMNQMPMVDVPGLPHDPRIEGKSAYGLISTEAVNCLILERRKALNIPAGVEEDLGPFLNAALDSDDPRIRQTATEIAHLLGGHFGRLIAILKTGQRKARPAWNDDIWAYWQGIRRVVVGGGLSTGRLGEEIVNGARTMLVGCAEAADLVIEQSAFGKWVTLVGLACRGSAMLDAGIHKTRVYDFGGTAVKMGWARYQDGLLDSLEVVSRNHDYYKGFGPNGDDLEGAVGVAERMVEQIASDLEPTAAYNGMKLAVLISMACYVHDGHPLEQGGYGLLGKVAKRDGATTLQEWLAWRIGARLGRAVTVGVFHDGTAAACAYGMPTIATQPEPSDTALFVLGTAIGYG
ncbi:MAG: hypothetical protein K8I30_20725, partial [Anaerolineae bacterium]|nr:hypothetical protein [Anaerolineae bacterium]